jgi:hypothetical protein
LRNTWFFRQVETEFFATSLRHLLRHFPATGFEHASELGDRLVQRLSIAEAELGRGAGGSAVAVDHLARLVAGPVLNPGRRPSVGQRDGDEGRPRVVRRDGASRVRGSAGASA